MAAHQNQVPPPTARAKSRPWHVGYEQICIAKFFLSIRPATHDDRPRNYADRLEFSSVMRV